MPAAYGYDVSLPRSERLLFAGGTAFLITWFLVFAGPGIHVYFSGDDMMNLYGAWSPPFTHLLKGNLLFFSTENRPLGSLWYRAIFAVAGFDPMPFRAVALAILLGNIWLTYCVARRISESREIAAVTALLASFNARMANLYFDSGAIYDVLCYAFYVGALLWHLRGGHIAGLAVLYICALNSKEMAVTLPAALLFYEVLYRKRPRWRAVVVTGILTLVYLAGKSLGSDTLLKNPAYQPVLALEHVMSNARLYMDDLFYRYGWFTNARVLLLWLGMAAVALVSRSKTLLFSWLFLTTSILPVIFIAPRAGSAIYVCLFGWALYAATAVVLATKPLGRLLSPRAKATAVFLGLAALIFPYHRFEGGFTSKTAAEGGEELRPVVADLHRLRPAFEPGASMLFLNDPIRADVHDLTFLVRLSYGDDTLVVHRVKMMQPPPRPEKWAEYDYVFDYADGRFREVEVPRSARTAK
jgi:hypothetical protein